MSTDAAVLPGEVQSALDSCETSLAALEDILAPLLSTPWDVLTAQLDPLEKAKLNLMMAYAVDSLYFIYLKTQVRRSPDCLLHVRCSITSPWHPFQGGEGRVDCD